MKPLDVYHKFFSTRPLWLMVTAGLTFLIMVAVTTATVMAANDQSDAEQKLHVVTIYDEDTEKTVISRADDIAGALDDAEISLGEYDRIEPALDQKLAEAILIINIHRARPIVVIDGQRQVRVITSAQNDAEIAAAAGVELYPEDVTRTSLTDDLLMMGGAGLQMDITRAKTIKLRLYGQDLVVRTQKDAVAEFLEEKKIRLGADDGMDISATTPIVSGMSLHIWRNGLQTVSMEEDVPFTTEKIRDPARLVGYYELKTAGQNGRRSVIYEIETRDGVEISRREIQSVATVEPRQQVEIIGAKQRPGSGLTKSKGVNYFQDSNGAIHRETYYDLNMRGVMRNCGQGGYYTVREDGVKVDRGGYVIIAAHLGRYPRCSVVETSVGAGKVYDTGGFVNVHPDGWDIATDWSKRDGI